MLSGPETYELVEYYCRHGEMRIPCTSMGHFSSLIFRLENEDGQFAIVIRKLCAIPVETINIVFSGCAREWSAHFFWVRVLHMYWVIPIQIITPKSTHFLFNTGYLVR